MTERPAYRDAAVKKACADIEKKYLPYHEKLIENLISEFESADHRLRQSLGTVLSRLSAVTPPFIQEKIELFFLQSQYVGGRRRGYKIASRHKELDQKAILKAWHDYGSEIRKAALFKAKHLAPLSDK